LEVVEVEVNVLKYIMQHPLATQELLGLLNSIGSPETSSETKTLARLAAAYGEMGKQIPSPELEADLAALYSNSLGVADAIQPALAALVTKHPGLALEAKGLATPILTGAAQEKFAAEWSKAFQQIDTDCTPVLDRRRELLFLTLKAATQRIRAALKQGAQD
jgi:hypothetical protein